MGVWDSLSKAVPIPICPRDCLKYLFRCFQRFVCFVDQYLVQPFDPHSSSNSAGGPDRINPRHRTRFLREKD